MNCKVTLVVLMAGVALTNASPVNSNLSPGASRTGSPSAAGGQNNNYDFFSDPFFLSQYLDIEPEEFAFYQSIGAFGGQNNGAFGAQNNGALGGQNNGASAGQNGASGGSQGTQRRNSGFGGSNGFNNFNGFGGYPFLFGDEFEYEPEEGFFPFF